MLPENKLSTRSLDVTYLYPDGIVFDNLVEDFEMGGIAIQDPSEGLQYQPWRGYWEPLDNTVYLRPNIIGDPIALFTETDVFEFSFAFDQNMRYATALFKTNGDCKFTWFNSLVGDYVTDTYTGLTAFKLSLDDKREAAVQSGDADVLFTYIKDNNLYFRAQRDRYLVEYLLAEDLPKNLLISNFGMGNRYRMQWRLRYRRLEELLPWLL